MTKEKTTGLSVELKQAEKIRKYLLEKNILRNDLKIKRDNTFVYFPVKVIPKNIKNDTIKIIEKQFEKQKIKPKSYKEEIQLPKKLLQELPTSYDTIGEIILIKLSKNLQKYKKEIGKKLLSSNKNIKTVCLIEPISGELRTRKVEIIAGEKRTNTIHKEHGLKFYLDVEKTYFSPRLATERKRVADLAKADEIVVDMFSGVAPFSIIIAKYANPKLIYAVDKNKEAVNFARQNIKVNNVLDKVEVIHSDANKISTLLIDKDVKADRVIMNLPFSAHLFFSDALEIVAEHSVIHYYDILEEEKIQKRIDYLKKIANKKSISLVNIEVRKIKTYAPREFYIGVDITTKKYADVA